MGNTLPFLRKHQFPTAGKLYRKEMDNGYINLIKWHLLEKVLLFDELSLIVVNG